MRVFGLMKVAAMLSFSATVQAQDLSPAIDPAQVGQGQVLSDMARNHGKLAAQRSRKAIPTAAQVSACAQKAKFRAQHGWSDVRVSRLYQLCRGVGL
jgi:hypothetical protein